MGNIEKFDSIANRYDTPQRIEIAKIIANTINAKVGNSKNKKAIDYGCGTGLVGLNLLDNFDSILFIDAASNMVEEVKQKIEVAAIKNASTLCCDLTIDNSLDLHTDYILMAQTLLHIKEIEQVLSRLYSLLNKDGHLIIVDFDKNEDIVSNDVHNGFNQEELSSLLRKIGFINADARTFYHGKKMFMNQDASLFILDAIK